MASQTPGQSSLLGLELGHFRIVERIGAGGMGEVYRAHDLHLDRDVAVKVLPRGAFSDEVARKRFRKEALALSKLNHQNIATVYDFDTHGDVDYLVMEYVCGKTLRDRISGGPLPELEIIGLGAQVAEGLMAAHKRGVVHRDLKPENVCVAHDCRAKILDFGLAKLIRPVTDILSTTASHLSAVGGTLPYMAPEQVLGGAVDERADLFSFGVVLYEMATGALPFRGETSGAVSEAILHSTPTSPLQLNPDVSQCLEAIILKALEKNRELRYQSAGEVLSDLHRLNSRGTPVQVSTSFVVRAPGRTRRIVQVAAGVILLLLVPMGFRLASRMNVSSKHSVAPVEIRTPSIAVLPFTDMSSEHDQEYFSDGITEELLGILGNVEGLRVTGRTSSFQFKGKNEDLRVIGQKLNVDTILEGSVRKQGKHVRITVQLINASDGFHVWAENYDRRMDDIFAVQDEIARAVVSALKLRLLSPGASFSQTKDSEAYNAYLLGRYFYRQSNSRENLQKSIAYYEQAIKMDAHYAPAWAGLAATRVNQALTGYVPADEGFDRARQEAKHALVLNQNLAAAHSIMGSIQMTHDWNWAGAESSYKRALQLEPGNARYIQRYAQLALAHGRFVEAIELIRNALTIDPLDSGSYFALGYADYVSGHLDEAVVTFKKLIELNPHYANAHGFLGQVYMAQSRSLDALAEMERETHPAFRLQDMALVLHTLGRARESDAALTELIAKNSADAALQIAEIYAFRREANAAFYWLEQAYAQRDSGLFLVKVDPLLRNLQRDPRWAVFVNKMELTD